MYTGNLLPVHAGPRLVHALVVYSRHCSRLLFGTVGAQQEGVSIKELTATLRLPGSELDRPVLCSMEEPACGYTVEL